MCHGITGNALAINDNASVMHLLSYTARDFLSKHGREYYLTSRSGSVDERFGLHSGVAGRAWGFVVAELLVGKINGYNDL